MFAMMSIAACADFVGPSPIDSTAVVATRNPDEQMVGMMRRSCNDSTWLECVPNPYPQGTAWGVNLGPDFSYSACTAAGGFDQDGLTDACEHQLAVSFRPLLSTSPSDQTLSRESYWAAHRVGPKVKIFYALAYHWDGGSDHWACGMDASGHCLAHPGDAEHIVLTVIWDAFTGHWRLESAYLSAHAGSPANASETVPAHELTYEGRGRHYPRVFVAREKHANYKSRAACHEEHLFILTDICYDNIDDGRVDTWSGRKLGSSEVNYLSTVHSVDPYIHTGNEDFWQRNQYFCGWDGPSLNHNRNGCSRNTSYASILSSHGF